jgi:23S rRNA pseudouridine1911/1915/1917 synthase
MTDQTPQKLDCQAKIPVDLGGERVDKVAALLFPEFSRAELTRWIGEGALTLNGDLVKPKYKVFGGELLELQAERQTREDWQTAESMDLDILFEDEDLLVINKPAGLVVHPGAGNADGTLVNGLLHHRPQLQELPRAGVVHRLDKETSGLMVVAGSSGAYQRLVEAISQRQVRRRYLAVCEGVMVSGQDVDRPIGRDPKQRTRQVIREDGKSALSLVRVRSRYRVHSAVNVTLGSGRTHQIRVHMQSIGHPLVGDAKYGCRRILPRGASADTVTTLQQFPRQALHAIKLDFAHPVSKKDLHFTAPIPQDLGQLMQCLEADANE